MTNELMIIGYEVIKKFFQFAYGRMLFFGRSLDKKSRLARPGGFGFFQSNNCYSGWMASTGQTSAHAPQSVQRSGSIL
jgi:hypothetical protein